MPAASWPPPIALLNLDLKTVDNKKLKDLQGGADSGSGGIELTFELETNLSATGLVIQPGQRHYKVIRSVKSARPSLNEELDSENGPWPWDKNLKCAASPKKLVLGDISQGYQPRLGDHGRWWGGQQWRGLLQLSCGLKINDEDSVSTKKWVQESPWLCYLFIYPWRLKGSFGFNMIISVSDDYGDNLGDAGGPWCSNPALWTDASP